MISSNVLIVDDDPDTCQMISMMLSHESIQVDVAYDGHQGIEKAKAHQPDLILLDVMMPGMDGWDTYRHLKDMSDVPVMFVSAVTDPESISQGLEMGACAYIAKPFEAKDLIDQVASFLPPLSTAEYHELPQAFPHVDHSLPGALSRLRRELYFGLKRLADIAISGTALIILSPLVAAISILIMSDSPGPAIFTQERVGAKRKSGRYGETWQDKPFKVYKFRTMLKDADPETHRAFVQAFIKNDPAGMAAMQPSGASLRKLTNDHRVTGIGEMLRKFSLDEVPQLWNVLKGDMSLVGPRPAIPYEVDMYQPWHLKRLEAWPGITGLWQVTGRSSVDFDEMINLDLEYINKQSCWLDLWILLKTPGEILSTKGAV